MFSESLVVETSSDYLLPTIKHTEINIKPPHALVIGDTHGNIRYTLELIKEASLRGVTRIIQLGDWGYLWPDTRLDDPTEALNVVSRYLLDNNITMYFIRGNHDWLEGIESQVDMLARKGFYFLNDEWWDLGFTVPTFFYGGAISIDRKYRREGLDYFKDEKPKYPDRETLLGLHRDKGWNSPALLFSHDSPQAPPGFEKPHSLMVGDYNLIADCKISQAHVAFVARQGWFTSVFHGHYHTSARYPVSEASERCTIHAINQVGSHGDAVYLDINGEVTV